MSFIILLPLLKAKPAKADGPEEPKATKKNKKTKRSHAKASFRRRGNKRLRSKKLSKAAKAKAKKSKAGAEKDEPAVEKKEIPLGDVVDGKFKGTYDLSKLPKEAWPQNRPNLGKHSYTLRGGSASIEVLLRCNAFYIKKVAADADGPGGQVSYKRSCPAEVWEQVKKRAGYVPSDDKIFD